MIHTKPDFYNSVQSDIKERYFKEEPNYSHNEKYNAAKYTIELFNNGCLNYRTFIGRLAKYCGSNNATMQYLRQSGASLNVSQRARHLTHINILITFKP